MADEREKDPQGPGELARTQIVSLSRVEPKGPEYAGPNTLESELILPHEQGIAGSTGATLQEGGREACWELTASPPLPLRQESG